MFLRRLSAVDLALIFDDFNLVSASSIDFSAASRWLISSACAFRAASLASCLANSAKRLASCCARKRVSLWREYSAFCSAFKAAARALKSILGLFD